MNHDKDNLDAINTKNEIYIFDAYFESYVFQNRNNCTPADLGDRWVRGYSLTSEEKRIIDVLTSNPETGNYLSVSFIQLLSGVLRAWKRGSSPYRLPRLFKSVIINYHTQIINAFIIKKACLIDILWNNPRLIPKPASEKPANSTVRIVKNSSILNSCPLFKKRDINYEQERMNAKLLVDLKNYRLAEKIYRFLLKRKIDPANVYTHLCRIYLLMGKNQKAARASDLAWENRNAAAPYVIGRMIWLKLLFACLRHDQSGANEWTGRMKYLFCSSVSRSYVMDWHIYEAFDLFKNKLGDEVYDLLLDLILTLSFAGFDEELLNSNKLWNTASLKKF